MKVGILDDDYATLQRIGQEIESDASHLGFPELRYFSRGTDMLAAVQTELFDCLVLDRRLPDVSGDTVLKWVRQYSLQQFQQYTMVIMLTHMRGEAEILDGLRSGADDYMVKPFRPAVLVERIRYLLELRKNLSSTPVVQASPAYTVVHKNDMGVWSMLGFQFHAFSSSVTLPSGESVKLSRIESDLGRYLLKNAGVRTSREKLIENVWHKYGHATMRALDTHIHKVRVKLKLMPEYGFDLRTIYGFGYCLYVSQQ